MILGCECRVHTVRVLKHPRVPAHGWAFPASSVGAAHLLKPGQMAGSPCAWQKNLVGIPLTQAGGWRVKGRHCRALGTPAVSLHSPRCTSCSQGQSRSGTAHSWNSAALGAGAAPAIRGRRDRPAGSHRSCEGTHRCHKQPLVGMAIQPRRQLRSLLELSWWAGQYLAVLPQFPCCTVVLWYERPRPGHLAVKAGSPTMDVHPTTRPLHFSQRTQGVRAGSRHSGCLS
jgi:hypothetical protein